MSRRGTTWLVFLMAGLVLAAGCSRSPEAKKARYIERGDKYSGQKQYPQAVIHYQNALPIDPHERSAIEGAGLAFYELGDMAQAFPYLVKTQELKPDDLDIRLKLGTIRMLARQPEQAREAANFILEREPKNVGALLLLAGLARSDED